MAGAAANLIRSIVQKNGVALFSKSYCPYCKLAKSVLSDAGATQKFVVELDLRADGEDIQDELKRMTGQGTVPHVFINQEFVGGGTDLEKLFKTGKLRTMLSR